jgi:exodeoxyribonuclease V gamma subunit
MLHLHLSNRPDPLVAALAALMRTDPLPLLETETVLVPATAVSRWLGFRLADALGIATRVAFPFPAAYAWQLFARVLPDVASDNPFERTAMQWRLLRLLGVSAAPEVQHFLAGDAGLKRYELAAKLAELFDRYLVERPDWLSLWHAGKRLGLGPEEGWQAELWRSLRAELAEGGHPRERFLSVLQDDAAARARLPRRIALFCVETMPALYWEIFAALAEWIDLHVFVLAPSREFWGDIDRLRTRLRMEIDNPEAAELFDVGHPLLASLGRARRHGAARLAEATERLAAREHHYFAAPPATLLGALQRDILDLTTSAAVPADASLQIHACHGPLREAEVLHDRLLALFEAMPDLRPADILILTPDIETYAPAVAAVLLHAQPAQRIPCAVADRPLAEAPLWRALRRLCAVAAGELDAEAVMSLLEEAAVRRAFGLDDDELPRLRDWVAEAGIRWGMDGAARARQGLPAEDAHTWRAGLTRLLLGVALPDVPERLHGDVLPVTGIEGARAELLGRFMDYAEALFAFAQKLGAGETVDLPAPDWTRMLGAALDRFIAPTEAEEGEAQRIRAALANIEAQARAARCATPLPLAALLRELDTLLAARAPAHAFASGAATIAALQPGRPLPARVICLVGMNDRTWPRPAAPLGFDLVARHPRPGDRDRRGEERYALLETLLCAQDALVVTYTGRDPRSNVEFPPAAPLAELLDSLAALTGLPAAELVVAHPLQPFSPAYFDASAPALFSYDTEQCGASRASRADRASSPFLAATHVHAPLDAARVDLPIFQRFLAHPVRHYLREALGIHLEESEELLEIHEPFVTDRRENYRLRAAHFAGLRDGAAPDETARLLRARGWLPHGVAGAIASAAAHAEVLPLWQAAQPWAQAPALPPVETSHDDGQTLLSGRLDQLCADGLWRLRFGKTRPQDLLRLWLEHLLLQHAAPPGVARCSVLLAHDGMTEFAPLADAPARLADLLDLYRQGLAAPLAFYPQTAWDWLAGKAGWRNVWEGSAFSSIPGEREDVYLRLALRDRAADPLGEEFQRLARRVFEPLRAAIAAGGADG